MLTPNTILQNRYRIVRELGRGGMGAVYEAFDLRLRRPVALKKTLVQTSELNRAFEHEARLLANLRHPYLPNILDHFLEDDGQFLIMEYIPGPDLSQRLIKGSSNFSVQQVLEWGDELLNVLEYLHHHSPPIVHRDIKPANLKVGENGQIILLDFGLAKGFTGGMTTSNSRSIVGYSPHYAPLEQMHGEKSDPRSDLYSTAATLYHLMTGQAPEEAPKRASFLFSDEKDPLLLATQLNPEIPFTVASVLAQALSLRPQDRPKSAAEMRAMLKSAVSNSIIGNTQPFSPSLGDSKQFRDLVYQTIPGKPELVADPFHTKQTTDSVVVNNLKGRWVFTVILGCALVVALYLFYISKKMTDAGALSQTSASQPIQPPIPGKYLNTLASIVSLKMKDAEGKSVGHASGFFVKEDEIVTDLSAFEGATQGQATIVGQHTVFNVIGVLAVDRELGLALLRVADAKAQTLSVAATPPISGSNIPTISASVSGEGIYSEVSLIENRKKDGLLEVGGVTNMDGRGGALLNERGEVVAILAGSSNEPNNIHAISATRIVALMKRQPSIVPIGIAGAKDVLYDFRKSNDSSKSVAEDKNISPELKRKVFSAVFRSYFTDANQCSDYLSDSTPEGLRVARNAGYIVPDIAASRIGSFTEPGVQQTAYLITVGECGAAHVVNWGTKRLAIFNGQNLVANVDVQDHTGILGIYDLNGDGINELLLTGGYMQSGEISEWADLITIKDARLKFEQKIGMVRGDDCASMSTKPNVEVAVIYYTKGAGTIAPELRIDKYRAKCTENLEAPNPSAFRYISSERASKS